MLPAIMLTGSMTHPALWLTLAIGIAAVVGCTPEDRAPFFSTARPPMVGRCDPQPGYPPPEQRPGCENAQITGRGK